VNTDKFIEQLFAAAKAAGIGDCEAYMTSGESFEVDILEGAIKEYNVSVSCGLCFRGIYGGKMGYASTQIMDEEAIELLIEGVKGNAELIETDDGESIYEGDTDYPEMDFWNTETVAIPASEKIALSLELEKKVKALDPRVKRVEGCGISSSTGVTRIVNSKGMDVSMRRARIGAGVAPIVEEDGKSNFGFAVRNDYSMQSINIDEIAEKAVTEAVSGLGAESIPSGSYRCVLRRDIAGHVLSTFSGVFSGEAARKGISLLRGREGEIIASDVITLIDDPLLEGGPASRPFDSEGVKCFTKYVIENGRLMTLLHNRKTAALMGIKSTGNASKAGYTAKVDIAPTNFYIKPSEKSFDELLEEVGDGIMITSLMGLHSGANGISGDFSLGAKGFEIKGGKLVRPIEQFTVAGNFFDILKNTVAVANDIDFAAAGSICCPSMYIGEIKVAGK